MSRDWDGSSSHYLETVSGPAALDICTATGPYSMAAWIKPDSLASEVSVVSKYNGTGPLLRIDGAKIRFFTVNSGASGREAIGATTITTGAWHLVGGAWIGSASTDIMRVTLDGVEDATTTMSFQSAGSATNWRIGMRPTGSNPFNGLIGMVGIWDVYLSDAEWLALAAGDCFDTVQAGHLKGFWILEGNDPETNLASSGSACDMDVVGPPPFDADEPTTDCGSTPVPPVNTVPPVASGLTEVGATLSTTDGTWTDADSFTYQWESSADGSTGWADVTGETSDTFLLTTDEIDLFIRCMVTAHNSDDDVEEPSNVLGPVVAYPTLRSFTVSG